MSSERYRHAPTEWVFYRGRGKINEINLHSVFTTPFILPRTTLIHHPSKPRNLSLPARHPPTMSPTVDELRNEIRVETGRYERVESTAFTKEALAAICEAVGYEIGPGSLPPKPEMRISAERFRSDQAT